MTQLLQLPSDKMRISSFKPILLAISITMLMFFIDEGYYDFRWMSSPTNWLLFAMFSLGFFVSIALAELLVKPRVSAFWAKILVTSISIIIGFFLSYILIYLAMIIKGLSIYLHY